MKPDRIYPLSKKNWQLERSKAIREVYQLRHVKFKLYYLTTQFQPSCYHEPPAGCSFRISLALLLARRLELPRQHVLCFSELFPCAMAISLSKHWKNRTCVLCFQLCSWSRIALHPAMDDQFISYIFVWTPSAFIRTYPESHKQDIQCVIGGLNS